jgi:type II pantothenate kinase
MIIGIDIGSTITKAVSIEDGHVTRKVKTRAQDALTSATGAFGKLLLENNIRLPDIERIKMTGAGASIINVDIFGIKTEKVMEIEAIGIGGLFLAKKENIVITNIGTGTVFIGAGKNEIVHIGGSGVGGGTILGLGKSLLGLSGFSDIMSAAEKGRHEPVDLLISDISAGDISFLRSELTAANFGKMLDTATKEDIALGILNMVYQVIGMLSVFAARGRGLDSVLVTGSGSDNVIGKKVLAEISEMYKIRFDFPPDAEYTTAIGAGLSRTGIPRTGLHVKNVEQDAQQHAKKNS